VTARVESWEKQREQQTDTLPAASISEPTNSVPDFNNKPNPEDAAQTVFIGEDEAKNKAYTYFKLKESEIKSSICKLELEGLKVVYDVDIITATHEYSCDVDAVTGEILDYEKDLRDRD